MLLFFFLPFLEDSWVCKLLCGDVFLSLFSHYAAYSEIQERDTSRFRRAVKYGSGERSSFGTGERVHHIFHRHPSGGFFAYTHAEKRRKAGVFKLHSYNSDGHKKEHLGKRKRYSGQSALN
jgi:hypothetical protein